MEKRLYREFNGKQRDELLNREIFYILEKEKVLIEKWRKEYNQIRPNSTLGYKPPTPEVIPTPFLANPLLGLLPAGVF